MKGSYPSQNQIHTYKSKGSLRSDKSNSLLDEDETRKTSKYKLTKKLSMQLHHRHKKTQNLDYHKPTLDHDAQSSH